MVCKISIIRNDNTHSISLFKRIFKKLSNYDDDNHIEVHLKPRTMIAEIDITCKSLNYYLSIMNALFKYSDNNEVAGVMDSLLYVLQYNEERYSTEYDDFQIIFKLKDNRYIDTWTLYSTNVYVYKCGKSKDVSLLNKSSDPIAEGYVMYDYDNHDFELTTWKDNRGLLNYISENLLYELVLLYNHNGKTDVFFTSNEEIFMACCKDHNTSNWSKMKKGEE